MAKLGKEQVMVAGEMVKKGVSIRQVARQLGVTEGALRYRLKKAAEGADEGWVFPAPESDGHVRVDVAGKWLREAERKAEDHTHVKGFGWHAFRRMWATKRKHLPAKDVAAAGGWKDTATLQRVYQHADPETMETVVMGGRDLRMDPSGDDSEDQAAEASR